MSVRPGYTVTVITRPLPGGLWLVSGRATRHDNGDSRTYRVGAYRSRSLAEKVAAKCVETGAADRWEDDNGPR